MIIDAHIFNLAFVIKFLVVVLATYRIAFEIAAKPGPFGLFERFRMWVTITSKSFWLEDWSTCPVCQSLWISLIWCILIFRELSPLYLIAVWFAVSGAIQVIHFGMLFGRKG